METTDLIPIQIVCECYNVPLAFINTLQEFQLIEIIVQNNNNYIHTKQIRHIEKMMRLHYDLDINFEGLDVIYNLLQKVKSLNENIVELHNKLKRFDNY